VPYTIGLEFQRLRIMGKLSEILTLAQQRAKAMGLPYEGALTPQEAFDLLRLAPGARLVDVRTRAEWDWVGRVPGAVEIEWNLYPGGGRNPNFATELMRQVDREALVLFLCRSGGRSDAAARLASETGYGDCYNILEGFEGDKDANGHRGACGGWRHAGLPWRQG
jgi:rhodanese-related sulfurtransferase